MRLNLKHKRNMPVSPPTEANHTKKQQNIEQAKVSHIFPRSEHNRSKPHQETKYRAAKDSGGCNTDQRRRNSRPWNRPQTASSMTKMMGRPWSSPCSRSQLWISAAMEISPLQQASGCRQCRQTLHCTTSMGTRWGQSCKITFSASHN